MYIVCINRNITDISNMKYSLNIYSRQNQSWPRR